MELGQYFVPAGRLASAATVLMPTVAMITLYALRKADLEAKVAVTSRLRTTLLAHATYFSALPFMFEGGLDVAENIINQVGLSIGTVPAEPDNLFHQMTMLSGELFFVAVVAYLLMSSLSTVPRWTLLVPLAQVSYNLKNSLIWLVMYESFSPVGKPNLFMLADFLFIFPSACVYASAYLGEAVDTDRKAQ